MDLQEYIKFRTELGRELFNSEVDDNFKMVSNPWSATRQYVEGNIVYKEIPLRVLLDQDGGMYVYVEDNEITDILMSSTLAGIEAVAKQALIALNTEDGQ